MSFCVPTAPDAVTVRTDVGDLIQVRVLFNGAKSARQVFDQSHQLGPGAVTAKVRAAVAPRLDEVRTLRARHGQANDRLTLLARDLDKARADVAATLARAELDEADVDREVRLREGRVAELEADVARQRARVASLDQSATKAAADLKAAIRDVARRAANESLADVMRARADCQARLAKAAEVELARLASLVMATDRLQTAADVAAAEVLNEVR